MIASRSFVATIVGAALAGLLASACAPASPDAAAAAEAEFRPAPPASAADAASPAPAPPTPDTPVAAARQSPDTPAAAARSSSAVEPIQPTVLPLTLEEAGAQVAARMARIQSQIDESVAAAEAARLAQPSQVAAPISDNTAPDASGNVP